MILKTSPDVVRGHEIWLEYESMHRPDGRAYDCSLRFGHNLVVDGIADINNAMAFIIDSGNAKQPIEITAMNDALRLNFQSSLIGDHRVAAEYDAGIYTVTQAGWHKGPKKNYSDVKRSGHYYQYAKTIIPGGSDKYANYAIGQELEIIPAGWGGHYHAGDTITLKVMYDGSALAEGMVTAVASSGKDSSIETAIAENGMVSIPFSCPGNWMFKVRHTDPSKGVEDLYDEKVITAVFTVMDVH